MTEIASGTSLPDIPPHLSRECKDVMLKCMQVARPVPRGP